MKPSFHTLKIKVVVSNIILYNFDRIFFFFFAIACH